MTELVASFCTVRLCVISVLYNTIKPVYYCLPALVQYLSSTANLGNILCTMSGEFVIISPIPN